MAVRWWDAKANDAVAWLFFQRRRHAALDEDAREFVYFVRSATGDSLVVVTLFLTAALCPYSSDPEQLTVALLATICSMLWLARPRWTNAPPQRRGARVRATTMLCQPAAGG